MSTLKGTLTIQPRLTGQTASGAPIPCITSIGLVMPPEFNVAGSPVTPFTGVFDVTKVNQPQGFVYAAPASGGAGQPAFRALTVADIPANAGNVQSVFGRMGAVVAQAGDYTAAQVTNAVDRTQSYADPAWITSLAYSKLSGSPTTAQIATMQTPWTQNIAGAGFNLSGVGALTVTGLSSLGAANLSGLLSVAATGIKFSDGTTMTTAPIGAGAYVQSVFGRSGIVAAQAGDYTAAQITNAVDASQSYINPAWITSLPWAKISGVPPNVGAVASVFGRTGAVVQQAGDYTAAQITNAADTTLSYANPAWITSLDYSKVTGSPSAAQKGVMQTPWLQDVSAAGFKLYSVGSLGVGVASPGFGLDVVSSANLTQARFASSASSGPQIRIWASAPSPAVAFWADPTPSYGASVGMGLPTGTLTNDTVFGAWNGSAWLERMRITNSGSVGIGTTAPQSNFVVSNGGAGGFEINPNATALGVTNGTYITSYNRVSHVYQDMFFDMGNSTAPALILKGNGAIGMGIAAPVHSLQLGNDDAAKLSTSTWIIASDARLKRNVRPLAGGLSVIRNLQVIEAEYNGEDHTPKGAPVVSFLADKVRALVPRAVTSHKGKIAGARTEVLDLNIHELLMHLFLAVQQLDAERSH